MKTDSITPIQRWRTECGMKPVQVYLPDHLINRLDYACEVSGLSRSDVVRQLLREINEPPLIRSGKDHVRQG